VAFFERYFTHAKGELGGKPFALEPWQRDYVRALFAEENGQRKIPHVAAGVATQERENRPCVPASLCGCCSRTNQAAKSTRVRLLATKARLVFDMARIAVEQSPILSQHLTVYRSAIVRDKTHGTYKALSS
jgi:phage terminase large subunit-like protein